MTDVVQQWLRYIRIRARCRWLPARATYQRPMLSAQSDATDWPTTWLAELPNS